MSTATTLHGRSSGPFPGLEAFGERDAEYFFGRAREAAIVADNLLAYPLSILFGPGGAGKTSLLHAGVLPALADSGDAVAICSDWSQGAAAGLRAGLDAAIATAAGDTPVELIRSACEQLDGRLLIVLDQFEELLAGSDPGLEGLSRALAAASPAAHVLIAIREDALGLLDRFEGAVPGLFDNLIQLRPLSAEASRAATLEAVEAWNAATGDAVTVEPSLVDAVIEQVGDHDTGPPAVNAAYLQLVMASLWEAEPTGDRRRLDLAAFERRGGAEQIIATHVDQAMDVCSRQEQQTAASMFRVLVTPSRTRVPQRLPDLADYAGVPEPQAHQVVERLTLRARLLHRVGDGRFQLSHEALAAPVLAWCERWSVRQLRRRERRRLLAIVCFVAALLVLATVSNGLRPLEFATVDARFVVRGEQTPPDDLLLVAIDDASLERLDVDWPIPRRLAGDAIDWIGDGGPRVIAYDADFSGRRDGDVSLAEAIFGAEDRVVLAAQATAPGGRVKVLGGNEVLDEIGARPGYAGFERDFGGVIRRPLDGVDGVPSFAVAAAETALDRPVALDGIDDAWIDYYGPEGTLRSVPLWKVVRRQVPQRLFRDKVVVVGLTSHAFDRHPVWGLANEDMSGVEVQATAIDTVRRGLPLRGTPLAVTVLLTILCAALPLLLSRWCSLPVTLAASLGGAILYAVLAVLAFDRGRVLPVVAPLAALLIAAFAVLLVGFVAQRPAARALVLALVALLGASAAGVLDPGRADAATGPARIVQLGPALEPLVSAPWGDFGEGVALSADGEVALVSGALGNWYTGTAWVLRRAGATWIPDGPPLEAPPEFASSFGASVALSADGTVALVGAPRVPWAGGGFVFERVGGRWIQRAMLQVEPYGYEPAVGASVALSADGRTALLGSNEYAHGDGTAWVFAQEGGSWRGSRLQPQDIVPESGDFRFPAVVALSGDGNTALVGAPENEDGAGVAWVYRRSGSTWAQDGPPLHPLFAEGRMAFGTSVALDADGDTALIGGNREYGDRGAVFFFSRYDFGWSQDAYVHPPAGGRSHFGSAVALSPTGREALIAGSGSAWTYSYTGPEFFRVYPLVPSGGAGDLGGSVAMSAGGTTMLLGGATREHPDGAVWTFVETTLAVPRIAAAGVTGSVDRTWLSAELQAGENPTGTMTFSLWGPDADSCAGPPAASTTVPVTGDDLYVTEQLTAREIGFYRMVASYSGDERNLPAASPCGAPTRLRGGPRVRLVVDGTRQVGRALSISVALEGGRRPTGHVDLELFSPLDWGCTTPLVSHRLDLQDGTAPPVQFVPLAAGTLPYTATYSGDVDNDFVAERGCLGGAAEPVIAPAQPALVTTPEPAQAPVGTSIGALAQVVGGFGPTGKVSFALFPPSDPGCERRPVAEIDAPIGAGTAGSGRFATAATGTYRFRASYSGDANHHAAASACGAAAAEVVRRRPALVVAASASVDGTIVDTAELRGGFAPTGNVRFTLFGPGDRTCARRVAFKVLAPLNPVRATTTPLGPARPGRYDFVVRYEGDANNEPAEIPCGANSVVVPGARSAPSSRASLRRATASRRAAMVVVGCVGRVRTRCRGDVTVTARAPGRQGRGRPRAVTIGRGDYSVRAGTTTRLRVPLSDAGRRMLRSTRRLPATVVLWRGTGRARGRLRQIRVTFTAEQRRARLRAGP